MYKKIKNYINNLLTLYKREFTIIIQCYDIVIKRIHNEEMKIIGESLHITGNLTGQTV
jgi:hypothetical protein